MEIAPFIKEDFLVFGDDKLVSEIIGKLRQYEKSTCLIFRNKKYLGIIEKKKLLKTRFDAKHVKVGSVVQKTPIISEHADVIETAYLMFKSNLEYLPVERNKKIIGVVTGIDVVRVALNLPEIDGKKVEEIKLLKPSRVEKDSVVATALNIMYKEHVDHVPVMDKGNVLGVLSYRDILRKYLQWTPKRTFSMKFNKMASTKGAQVDTNRFASLPVQNFSTNHNLVTTRRKEKILDAVERMSKNNVSDLLVMSGNELVGLFTVKNLLRFIGSLKIPTIYNIKFVGLRKASLSTYDQERIKKVSSNEAFKLQRLIKNEFMLTVHIKEYEKDGRKHKYSVHMRLEYPGLMITGSQDDWDIVKALRKVFDNVSNKTKSQFKTDAGRGRYSLHSSR